MRVNSDLDKERIEQRRREASDLLVTLGVRMARWVRYVTMVEAPQLVAA